MGLIPEQTETNQAQSILTETLIDNPPVHFDVQRLSPDLVTKSSPKDRVNGVQSKRVDVRGTVSVGITLEIEASEEVRRGTSILDHRTVAFQLHDLVELLSSRSSKEEEQSLLCSSLGTSRDSTGR